MARGRCTPGMSTRTAPASSTMSAARIWKAWSRNGNTDRISTARDRNATWIKVKNPNHSQAAGTR